MRVSDRHLYDFSTTQLRDARSRYADAQEKTGTGRDVRKPSDDPIATSLAIRARAREVRAEANQRQIDAGVALVDAQDAALDDVANVLRRVQELAMQGATDTLGATERAGIAKEVEALRAQVVALANTEVDGHYVFAGYPDDRPPFDAAGAYSGDGSVRELEVAPGVTVATGTSGATTFGAGSGVDVLAVLESLRVALATNDVAGIRAGVDEVGQAHRQVVDARAEVGAKMNAFDAAHTVADRTRDQSIVRQGDLLGIDPVDAVMELRRAQDALDTAMTLAAQIPRPGLGTGGG
jgi:flagellar hook-associated protein 3 FlgL